MTKDEKIITIYKNMKKIANIGQELNLPRSNISALSISDENKSKVAILCKTEIIKAFVEIITCEGD